MEQMPTTLPQEVSIKSACRIHGADADDNRPLKLVGSRENDCCHVRQNLEQILERRLDCGEGTAMVVLDLLSFTV
jgi:hypothetical protein